MQSKPPLSKDVERIAQAIRVRRYGVCEAMDLICLYDSMNTAQKKRELIWEVIDVINEYFPPTEHAPNMVFASPAINWMMIAQNKFHLIASEQLGYKEERESIGTAMEAALQFLTKEEIILEERLCNLNKKDSPNGLPR